MTDVALLSQARKEAFEIVEQDPEFSAPMYADIKRTYEKKYKDRVVLIDVG